MKTLTVRFSEEDLADIKLYSEKKKISQAAAIRELTRLALKIDLMQNNDGNSSVSHDEMFEKLAVEHASFAIESAYIVRAILAFIMGTDGVFSNKSAKEIQVQATATARTLVRTTIGLKEDN